MTDRIFLTEEELVVLTKKKRRDKQIARLRELRIAFIPSDAGFPVVAVREIERRLVKDPKIRTKDRPRLELVR
jgi:hypothetical protein